MELWAKLDGAGGLVWNKWVDSHEDKQLKLQGSELQAYVFGDPTHLAQLKWDLPARSVWHHISVSYDGTRHRLFVDGKHRASHPFSFPASDAKGDLCFGANETRGFHGADMLIADVRISTAARYTTDFQPPERLMADKLTRALWHFGEISDAGDIADDSGNGHEAHAQGEVARVMR
jgi:hypothetical protein